MSEEEWYTDLTGEDLIGKHVHVEFQDGFLDGKLNMYGYFCPDWYGDSREFILILEHDNDGHWAPTKGIKSVSLVWDERDWKQIRTEDIRKADAIVVNGRLLRVTSVIRDLFFVDGGYPAHISFISCALRRCYKLPTEPGFYRDGNGTLYYLSTLAEFWIMRTKDKWDCMKGLPNTSKHFTPVHFVDGREGEK